MLTDLYSNSPEDENNTHGFLARDLIRFFIVDIILIIAAKLMVGLGVITHPDTHVGVILAGKVVLLLYLFWLVRDRRDAWTETGAATAGKWWAWPASIALYAAAYPALVYVDRFNRVVMLKLHAWLDIEYVPTPQDVMILIFEDILSNPVRIVLILFVVLIGPFMEELAFRGVGMDSYRRRSGVVWALVITSVLFGLYHFSIHLVIPLSFLGLIFGIARVFSHSLWCAILIHCLHNGLTLAVMAHELGILDTLIPGRN